MRVSPRLSPITVTTSSRYESSTRNISGNPRNFSSSPSPKRDTHSPSGHFVTTSSHRMSSPVTVLTHHRLSSPTTTTAPRLSSPSFNTSKVIIETRKSSTRVLKCLYFRVRRIRSPKRVRRTRHRISFHLIKVHHI